MNELKDICERLEGYKDPKWIVTKAEMVEPGKWVIEIEQEEKPGETAGDANADK